MNINIGILVIQCGVALTMLVFGINQMLRPTYWVTRYIPQVLISLLPMKPVTFMRLHALGNIIFGLFLVISFGHPLVAAWVALIWWITILPFAFRFWEIGMRDLTIIFSLIALIILL